VGAGQKAAGESISKYIAARESPEAFEELMGPIREAFNLDTEKIAAQQKEELGVIGGRFGTGLAREQGRLRGERGLELDSLMSQLFLGEQQNLLGAIGTQGQLGTAAIAPFLQALTLGVQPEETVVGNSPFQNLLDLGSVVAAIMAGAKGPGGGTPG
jgi:hypothetical protein